MKVLDLFSGIGGFSLGLERAGMTTVAFAECEIYCQKVLRRHWPDVPIYEDVRDVSKERLESDGITGIDVITGGFPCQDISVAGKQAGIEGERSGLWGELARIIGDIRPRYAIVENVTALLSGDSGKWFGRVLGDLAEIGYDCEWHCIPASRIGARHKRDRIWIVAHSKIKHSRARLCGNQKREINKPADSSEAMADTNNEGLQGDAARGQIPQRIITNGHIRQGRESARETYWASEPELGRVAHGVPNRSHRLKGLGNAVVPQIPELIGRAIMDAEKVTAKTHENTENHESDAECQD